MLFVDEAVLPQSLTALTDMARLLVHWGEKTTYGDSVTDSARQTKFVKAGSRLVDANGATYLVGSPDWR